MVIKDNMDFSSNNNVPPVSRGKISILSVEEKIKQAVNFGSVFLALKNKNFDAKDLMIWLAGVDTTEFTQIAYKALCGIINPNNQYLKDGSHFLVHKPEYTMIGVFFGLDIQITDNILTTDENPLMCHLCEILSDFNTNAETRNTTKFLCNGNVSERIVLEKLTICYKARNFPNLHITAQEINESLVEADWIEKFRYNEGLAKLVLKRIVKLQEAPMYYAGVACKEYRDVVAKLYKEKLLTQLTKDELSTLNSFLPNIIDDKILKYNDLAYKIALLGNDIAGYVLGFPIQNMIPNDEQIDTALQYLMQHGAENYIGYISKYIEPSYLPIPPFPVNKHIYSNDQDVMLEDHNNYTPFDVVSYRSGDHIFRFTRVEFDKLLESKKNPWTNDWLPPTILSTIKSRHKAAKELGLPPSRTLEEMLQRIAENKLFETDKSPPNRQNEDNNPFRLAMGRLSFISNPFSREHFEIFSPVIESRDLVRIMGLLNSPANNNNGSLFSGLNDHSTDEDEDEDEDSLGLSVEDEAIMEEVD